MSLKITYLDDTEHNMFEGDPLKEEITRLLEEYFSKLAQGNEGYARVEQLDLNGTKLTCKILIRHKHVTKSPFGKITVYAAKTYVELDTDVLNPKPDDLRACVDTPLGQICITLQELISIIAGLLA